MYQSDIVSAHEFCPDNNLKINLKVKHLYTKKTKR